MQASNADCFSRFYLSLWFYRAPIYERKSIIRSRGKNLGLPVRFYAKMWNSAERYFTLAYMDRKDVRQWRHIQISCLTSLS